MFKTLDTITTHLPKMTAHVTRAEMRAAAPSLVILLLLLSATAWIWHNSRLRAMINAEARFAFEVMEVESAISERLTAYEQILLGGVGLFAASHTVTRDEWHKYVSSFSLEKRFPGIRGMGYAKVIAPADLDEHITTVRAEGFPDYRVHPQGRRDSYTAIIYLEPFDWRNQRAFGYDMFSEPVRHAAMALARDSGRPAVSGRVTLLQETSEGVQHGFLLYLPFYQGEPETVDARRQAVRGYVYAPFRMNDLMAGTLGREPLPKLRMQIYDDGRLSADTLMYDSASRLKDKPDPTAKPPKFSLTQEIDFNGRSWLLQFSSLPSFEAGVSTQVPNMLLLSGTVISLLFSAVFWSLSLNRQRARALSAANLGLESEIVERTRLQAKLVRAKEAAEQASRAKSHFLANVSHELRTPLTLILSPLEQLSGGQLPPDDWRSQIALVRRNALHLLSRVNELLDFSKAEAGKFKLHPEEVAIGPLLASLVEDARSVAQAKDCRLSCDVGTDLDKIYTDRRHFETIALNYLSNALKFTPQGGDIRLQARRVNDDQFEFRVSDTGAGIPTGQQGQLFQRFSQLDNSATRHHGGTGIGLALVRQLAELLGGEAGVSSEGANKGASFYVRLPCKCSHQSEPGQQQEHQIPIDMQLRRAKLAELAPESRPLTARQSAKPGQDERILVVDDNADMRGYIAQLLAPSYQVVTAGDGEQALGVLENQAIDLVLSDVMMPRLDGFDLTARLKQSPQLAHLPVILVTARGGSAASVEGLAAGADDYIAKPFSADELLARVAAALRMAKTQQALRQAERSAGSALMAATLLHNLGNILNGVTVPLSIINEKLQSNAFARLPELIGLLEQHKTQLPQAVQGVPEYLQLMAQEQECTRRVIDEEMAGLSANLEQAVQIIRRHQEATARGNQLAMEAIAADVLMEKALELVGGNQQLQGIEIHREYGFKGLMTTDPHLVLQVLVNLIVNAAQAITQLKPEAPWLRLETHLQGEEISLVVADNGEGIIPANLEQLFDQHFTTRAEGHGFGLHTGALWIKQLGGTLSARSAGVGQGATFIITLPRQAITVQTRQPMTGTQA
jgi:signal transduction histidine kinase